MNHSKCLKTCCLLLESNFQAAAAKSKSAKIQTLYFMTRSKPLRDILSPKNKNKFQLGEEPSPSDYKMRLIKSRPPWSDPAGLFPPHRAHQSQPPTHTTRGEREEGEGNDEESHIVFMWWQIWTNSPSAWLCFTSHPVLFLFYCVTPRLLSLHCCKTSVHGTDKSDS